MIWRYLAQMFADNGLVEIRAIGNRVLSGVFDSPQAVVDAVRPLNRSGEWKGIYALLNAPRFTRAENRLSPRRDATSDGDILRITRVAFDFDPVREEGYGKHNASADELVEAKRKTLWLRGWLSGRGWPEPLVAMSGNGYHLQYRTNLTPGDELSETLRALYAGLAARCTTAEVKFDTVIRNPSRIFRLYGTTARKSEHTSDRPQRTARCVVPEVWEQVDLSQIRAVADEVRPQARAVSKPAQRQEFVRGSGDYRTLDVVAWFRAHGFYKRAIDGEKHAVICPWADEHSTDDDPAGTDTAVWEASATQWPSFRCLHAHCDHRGIRDVMAFFADQDSYCARRYGR